MDIQEIEKRIINYEKRSLPFYLKLLKLVDIQAGGALLDVGCGGCPLLTLNKRLFRLIGLDEDERVLEIAKKRARGKDGVLLVKADAFKMPFPDNALDAVIACSFPLDTPGFTSTLIDELARVLKPGKRLAILEDVFVRTGRSGMIFSRLERLGLEADIEEEFWIVYAKKPERLTALPKLPPRDIFGDDDYPK